jgi:hypothetical protein
MSTTRNICYKYIDNSRFYANRIYNFIFFYLLKTTINNNPLIKGV